MKYNIYLVFLTVNLFNYKMILTYMFMSYNVMFQYIVEWPNKVSQHVPWLKYWSFLCGENIAF
jgi:hypothetical protein